MNRPATVFYGDSDKDGVYNGLDCAPRNPKKQGPQHKNWDAEAKEIKRREKATASEQKRFLKLLRKSNARRDAKHSPNWNYLDEKLKALKKSGDYHPIGEAESGVDYPKKEEMRTGTNRLKHDAEDMVMPIKNAKGGVIVKAPKIETFDDDEFEAERRERERQKERDEFDIPDERASSIIKKKGKMALIRHHYPDSPISELPSTWEIKDNTGKSYWHSGIAYRSSGATEEEERKNAMEKFAKFEDDDDYLSPKEREAVEEEFEKEKAAWKKARGERH